MRSCEELGVCQGSGACHCEGDTVQPAATLPPGGFWFAPGTIEGEPQDTSAADSLAVNVVMGIALTLFCALLGLSVGWLQLPGWLG